MRVIRVKFIHSSFPRPVKRVGRKTVPISQCDQVIAVPGHFAVRNILRENIALPEEMSCFMAYKTPAAPDSWSWLILPGETGRTGRKLLDRTGRKDWHARVGPVLDSR